MVAKGHFSSTNKNERHAPWIIANWGWSTAKVLDRTDSSRLGETCESKKDVLINYCRQDQGKKIGGGVFYSWVRLLETF